MPAISPLVGPSNGQNPRNFPTNTKRTQEKGEDTKKKTEQTQDEQMITQAEPKCGALLISYLNQEQKEKLEKATNLLNHTYGVTQLEAKSNLRRMRIELGLIKKREIVTMRRETRASKNVESATDWWREQ